MMDGMMLTWTLPHAVAGTMVLSLNAYVLLGGADFGGGVWDLLARGPNRDAQRQLVANAIGPIWEANHVWLILVVVLCFTCFPRAFAHFSTELHLPLTAMLVGIVLRGSAFTFRSYDRQRDDVQRRWGRVFSVASLLTPIVLGVCLGAVAAGRVPLRTLQEVATLSFRERFLDPWMASGFPWAVGFLTLILFAFLAASYLTCETTDPSLRDLFRRRALQSQLALLCLAALTLAVARVDNPRLFAGLTSGRIALLMHGITALAAMTSMWALFAGRFQVARLAAAAQASFILWGWAWTQFPWLIPPNQTITTLSAPRITMQLTLSALTIGTVILLPSFIYLFRVFKRREHPFVEQADR
jgi:cytochrome bd ubiquinol oxidase subunit II